MEEKIARYNEKITKNLRITSRIHDDRLIFHGSLRVHWGVTKAIQLREQDEGVVRLPDGDVKGNRKSCIADLSGDSTLARRSSLDDLASEEVTSADGDARFGTIAARPERRSRKDRLNRSKRLSMINGHVYKLDTSIFTPTYGAVTSVTISNTDSADKVLKLLLDKFKVENNAEEFTLFVHKNNGEVRALRGDECPLALRLTLGPLEDEAKIFITEVEMVTEIKQEVAQYINLPEAVLTGFLQRLTEELAEEKLEIKKKYLYLRKECQKLMESCPVIMTTQL